MFSRRLVGAVLLIGGIILLISGIDASHSIADQVTHSFSGHFTDHTTLKFAGGAVAALLGLALVLWSGRRRAWTD